MDKMDVQYKAYFLKIVLFFICNYFLTSFEDKRKKSFFSYILIIDMLIYTIGFKIMYAERISYYYSMIIYLYMLSYGSAKSKQPLLKFILIIFILIYFYITYINIGIGHIYPYHSNILGI